ncbi:MAG: enoyl-CoA hydratase, partial [Pseudomonadales bacterium]|nr:enoyl-CoA hydratase [Pseudomonadales bacterium]
MSNIILEQQDEISIITINRPEVRNAVDGPTATELSEAFSAFD